MSKQYCKLCQFFDLYKHRVGRYDSSLGHGWCRKREHTVEGDYEHPEDDKCEFFKHRWFSDYSTKPSPLYLCDRQACKHCSPECRHTKDITHAKNFELGIDGVTMVEREPVKMTFFKRRTKCGNDR